MQHLMPVRITQYQPPMAKTTTPSTTILKAIIAVGYKVNSERAVQFRKWATDIVSEYTIKAYVMDDERLKSGHMLTEQDSCR